MKTKMIEIRDRMTTIAAMAIQTPTALSDDVECAFFRQAGFGHEFPEVILMRIDNQDAGYDTYHWTGSRTMTEAHKFIKANWNVLEDGSVVDVEYVLGESAQAKLPEIWRA
jgi:hypothetical protein